MPTYEYRCKACGHEFEAVQRFTDDPLSECPVCGSEVRKVFGSVGIAFKGSGFYKTDSRSGSTRTKAGAGAAKSSDGASGSSSTPSDGATKTPTDTSSTSSSSTSTSSSPSK